MEKLCTTASGLYGSWDGGRLTPSPVQVKAGDTLRIEWSSDSTKRFDSETCILIGSLCACYCYKTLRTKHSMPSIILCRCFNSDYNWCVLAAILINIPPLPFTTAAGVGAQRSSRTTMRLAKAIKRVTQEQSMLNPALKRTQPSITAWPSPWRNKSSPAFLLDHIRRQRQPNFLYLRLGIMQTSSWQAGHNEAAMLLHPS